MRVLLVEDEQPLAGYTEAGLRKHGFTVDVALDGRTALDKCEITPYDVVVLDRDLPDHRRHMRRKLGDPPLIETVTGAGCRIGGAGWSG
ncbi:response regulator [Nonomuraea sp. NEAU-A123]|uniref:response regulator n=1 Tax=Nonomuraea sp. NEAU-A123 TaxID=2839649 RepID=UPI001BE3D5A3|nr:response regulator [Nonomuraea sp. NEAU-A123]MBT2226329.1 hypothetical protein [Nonomuraea sp. NEAU-A123]